VVERPGAKRGETTDRSVASAKLRGLISVVIHTPPRAGKEGVELLLEQRRPGKVPGNRKRAPREPSSTVGAERADGCARKWGDPPRPATVGDGKRCLAITGDPGKRQAAERKSEGAVVAGDGEGPHSQPDAKGPTSSVQACEAKGAGQ